MRRDDDYLRELLMRYEEDPDPMIVPPGDASDLTTKEMHHLSLLIDQGYITSTGKFTYRLTNAGHDFLSAIRDEGLWTRTKETVMKGGGNATLDMLKTIATAYLKKQFKDRTGLDL